MNFGSIKNLGTVVIIITSLLVESALFGYSLQLPDKFCQATSIAAKKGCGSTTINFDSKNPVFLFLIHGTFSKDDQFLDGITLNNDAIPQGFFTDARYNGQAPIKFTFSWSGENSNDARIAGGKDLGNGLNQIIMQCTSQGVDPKIILVGHSHGGNVIAVATNVVTKALDCAILLATPVLRDNQKVKTNNDFDLYLPKSVNQLFLFYSMTDFVQTAGSAQNVMRRTYGPIAPIDLYNVRILINGQATSHGALYTQLIEDKVLELCKKIKDLYKKNKNLVANITSKNSPADKLIAIRKYDDNRNTNILLMQSADPLWPNWQENILDQQESKISEDMRAAFKNVYKEDFTDTAPLIDRTVRSAQQGICTRVIGKTGFGLNFLADKTRKTTAKFCCPSEEFKNQHKNAASALGCSTMPQALSTLSPEENEDVCINVIGTAGLGLAALGDDIKDDLKNRCCPSSAFRKQHPNASRAIGCSSGSSRG